VSLHLTLSIPLSSDGEREAPEEGEVEALHKTSVLDKPG